MKKIPFWVVDAFTEKIFGGNPAAVCLLEKKLSNKLLQEIASEFNLSETAFLQKRNDGSFDLRWFTPSC